MRRIIITLFTVFILGTCNSNAQNLNNLEKLNAYKIAFFTRKINLSSSEAEKFWPVYNEYQNKRNLIQQEKNKLLRTYNQNEASMTDGQLIELGNKIIAAIVEESALDVELHKKLVAILPPGKVIRVYQAETQYKTQLLIELQNARQN